MPQMHKASSSCLQSSCFLASLLFSSPLACLLVCLLACMQSSYSVVACCQAGMSWCKAPLHSILQALELNHTHHPEYSVDLWCRQEIIEKLHGQVVRLSQHKFASNVIEKCLQYGGSNSRQVISPFFMQQQPLLQAATALASCNTTTALAACSHFVL